MSNSIAAITPKVGRKVGGTFFFVGYRGGREALLLINKNNLSVGAKQLSNKERGEERESRKKEREIQTNKYIDNQTSK